MAQKKHGIFHSKSVIFEQKKLERIIRNLGELASSEIVAEVTYKDKSFPLQVVSLGSKDPTSPALAYFGGVHGLEKIGSEVILAYLKSVAELLKWDKELQKRLEHSRLIFMPLVNPVGIYLRRRANGNGIDLMRNAPIDAEGPVKALYCGHRISSKLPWYRGEKGMPMEVESQALCKVVREHLFSAKVSIAVDVHSGFGMEDRLWFPYAKTNKPPTALPELFAFKKLFDRSYPRHFYKIEPISRHYTFHGDLWDYLYDEYLAQNKECNFYPWTLELGSWMWIRKNPLQAFQRFGPFHPLKPHRYQRILRRHNTLFDFLQRSLIHAESWLGLSEEEKNLNRSQAMELWYVQK